MSKDFYDVIIIGSGAAGAAAAWNLSNKGLKIICLEQGSYTNPDLYPKNKSEICKLLTASNRSDKRSGLRW